VLESLPVVLIIGTALGFLAGIGVGGGSLLILWLTLVLGMDHPEARIINLLFFLPSAIVSSIFRWKQGKLEIKKVLPAIIVGCVAAGVCSFLSSTMDTSLLQKLFGGLLILTGIRELLYKPKS
jgi:uncharacterized membrane protein YfcA